ncbi:MAG: TonB-dependent receptor [Cyclobacteriaceae bacterium]|uniref:TonB-dependent receptor n=1 Tax=Reichenbachiella sp. TaxID=2184521 RepID=UPI003263C3AB
MADSKSSNQLSTGKLGIAIAYAIVCISFLLIGNESYAQTGFLSGKIISSSDKETLTGATVILKNSSTKGSVTDIEGNFIVSNVPLGNQIFVVSFIGFKSIEKAVDVVEGENYLGSITLEEDLETLNEVVISAQALGQNTAIREQLNSDAIVNVVSSDKIQELPDVNAAEAIGRISGVSVQRSGGEANSIILRGLNPELTSITINGIKQSPTDANSRAVDLSTVSPDLLSSIEVFKSPTADMDGDAIGGIVNLGLGKAQADLIRMRVFGGYNGLVDEYRNYRGNGIISNRFLDNKLGVAVGGNFERTNRSAESSNIGWDNNTDLERFNVENFNLSITDRVIERYGANLKLDYDYGSGSVISQLFINRKNTDTKSLNNDIGATLIEYNPRHSKVQSDNFQLMLSGEQDLGWFQANWVAARNTSKTDNFYDVEMEFTQFNGVREREDFAYNLDDFYDRQTFDYSEHRLDRYYWEPSKTDHENTTLGLDLKRNFSFGSKTKGFVKLGGKYRADARTRTTGFEIQNWYYLDPDIRNQAASLWPIELVRGGLEGDHIMIDNFFASGNPQVQRKDRYVIHPNFDFGLLDDWHKYQQSTLEYNVDNAVNTYSVDETVTAGYVMAKVVYGDWLTFIPGLRYERSDNEYTGTVSSLADFGSIGNARDTTTFQVYGEFLPSAHLKIHPKDWYDIRLSAVKTLARPNYNQLIPSIRIDASNGKIQKGNPELKHAEAWNFDAFFSIYPKKLGLITFGGFYKKFDNFFARTGRVMGKEEAISQGIPVAVYDVTEDYINFDDSRVYGIEFEIQTNTAYLSGPWQNIVLSFNLTRLWSETLFPRFETVTFYDPELRRVVVDLENSSFVFSKNKLPNQVDWQSNLSLGYDYAGFSIRLSTIYQAAYLTNFNALAEAGLKKFSNRFRDSFLRFDASISQKIGKHIQIMANAANITNTPNRNYLYLARYPTNNSVFGATFDLGLQYKF